MSDTVAVDVEWLATTAGNVPAASNVRLGKYFVISDHVGLFADHAIPRGLWVVPQLMRPNDSFHLLASRSLRRFGLDEFRRTPYVNAEIAPTIKGDIVKICVDLFPGDVRLVSVRARLELPYEDDAKKVIESTQLLRSPKQLPFIDSLIRETLALSTGDRGCPRGSIQYSTYFTLGLTFPTPLEIFESYLLALRSHLVALLIGAPEVQTLQPALVDRVLEHQSDLNGKASGELLMINRQGLLYMLPRGEYQGPHVKRLPRTRDLIRLGLFAQTLMRDEHQFSLAHPGLAELLRTRLTQWILYPELTFDSSVSQTLAWTAVLRAFMLPERLDAWERMLDSNRGAPFRALLQRTPNWWSPEALDQMRELG